MLKTVFLKIYESSNAANEQQVINNLKQKGGNKMEDYMENPINEKSNQKAVNFQDIINNVQLDEKYEPKESWKSCEIPQQMQFQENWGWEDSYDQYQYELDFFKKNHFYDQDFDYLIMLFRHMENFMLERGISVFFMRNYAALSAAFDDKENDEQKENSYHYCPEKSGHSQS